MAAGALETLKIRRPRIDLAIASSCRRSSHSIRGGGELSMLSHPLPQFTGLRVSRCLHRIPSANTGPKNPKADRLSTVTSELQEIATEVPDVTEETWQSNVMECDKPAIVEFWAPWCGPCRVIHPVIAKLAKTYKGRLKCYKINTDECPDIASQYGVRSIPTIMLFKNGEKRDAVIGSVPESMLVSCIDKFLGR